MRRYLCLAALLLLFCASCTGESGSPGAAGPAGPGRPEALEAPEELYEAAREEDVLRIYSNTTRLLDTKRTFEARYPGLVADIVDIRGSDMLGLLARAHAAGEYLCDLMVCADNNGVITRELTRNGVLEKYVPADIAPLIQPECMGEDLVFFHEAVVLFYNGQRYPKPPLANWWELTEPRFRGKVYLSSPQKSLSTYALLSMIIRTPEPMALAYRELYGEPLPEPGDAGREFLRRLISNHVVFVNSSDEIVDAVGAAGQEDPPVGVMVSSKMRMNEIGYRLEAHYGMEPFAGMHSTDSVMVVSGAKNPNAARLFVRWLLGEADGTGEGYRPYLLQGAWSVRSDVASLEPIPLESLTLLELDKDYVYDNRESFQRFWIQALEKNT